jgi:radical SAM superfamily enzyme YgiQ (UPF0313 family)
MNILVLNPPYDTPIIREGRCQSPQDMRKTSIPQLTLAYLCGILKKDDHTVLGIDCIADDVTAERLFNRLEDFAPDFAIVNTTTPSIDADLEFIALYKKRFSECFVAVFGTHVTALHEEIMNAVPALDAVIRYEPEWTARDLAKRLDADSLSGTVAGCTYRRDGQVIVGEERDMSPNLDDLGYPDWDFFDISRYEHPVLAKPYLTVNTSRGCVHNCIFCVGHIFYGKKMRYRSVVSVVDEIEFHVIKKYHVNLVWMYADDFTANPEFVKSLCREIIRRKLKIIWWTNTRVDKPDEEMYRLMKEAGCYMLSIGGESGNAEILKSIRKGTKPEFIKNTVRLLRMRGINSLVYFLIGLPGETRKTIRETIKFAKMINPDYAEFYPATPYPGTEFYTIACKQGLIADTNWRGYMCGGSHFVVTIPGLSKEELDQILRSAYRQFYVRPAYFLLLFYRMVTQPSEFVRLIIFGLGYIRRFFTKN